MPRLVGLMEGLNLILSGKMVKPAVKAYKSHLVDAIVPAEFKEEKLAEFINQITTPKGREKVLARRKRGGLQYYLLEANPLGRSFVFRKAEKSLLEKTKGHYPAPLIALKLIKNSYGLPLREGLEEEIRTVTKEIDVAIPISQNLINLFFTNEALKK